MLLLLVFGQDLTVIPEVREPIFPNSSSFLSVTPTVHFQTTSALSD